MTRHPAISWNAYGAGFAGYFVFDLPRTLWLLHQGRPREPMGKTRGVCPECGHMTAWFKVRLFIGGFFALLALFGILLMLFAPPG